MCVLKYDRCVRHIKFAVRFAAVGKAPQIVHCKGTAAAACFLRQILQKSASVGVYNKVTAHISR